MSIINFEATLPLASPQWVETLEFDLKHKLGSIPGYIREGLFTLGHSGFNNHLLSVANQLAKHCTKEETFMLLRKQADCHSRTVWNDEIFKAINKAFNVEETRQASESWPMHDSAIVIPILSSATVHNREGLTKKFGRVTSDTSEILRSLFSERDLVCMGQSHRAVATASLVEHLKDGTHNKPFIVPSPMTSREGTTKDGKISQHCLDNTGPRKYVVIEFDNHDERTQAALIEHLANRAPLAMVVYSGGKSLHAWFACAGIAEDALRKFMNHAVALGADSSTWTRSQFVRTPGATRDSGAKQEVVVFRELSVEQLNLWQMFDSKKEEEITTNIGDFLDRALLNAPGILAMRIRERVPIIEPFFLEGDLAFVYGPRGLGKTWLTLGLAKVVSSGGELGPWRATKSRKVLVVDGEMNLDATQSRLGCLDANSENLYFMHHEQLFLVSEGKASLNLADLGYQAGISAFVAKYHIEVLILDNLSCLFRGIAENEADAWEAVLPWLLNFRRAGVAVVIVAHSGRSGQHMRGTSRREDAAHWTLSLTEPMDTLSGFHGARFKSTFTKNRNATGDNCPPLIWEFVTSNRKTQVTAKIMSDLDELLDLIRDGMSSATDLARELDITKGTVSKWAKKLADQGKITKIQGGQYKANPSVDLSAFSPR